MNKFILLTSCMSRNLSIAKKSSSSKSIKLKYLSKDSVLILKNFFNYYLFDHSVIDYPSFSKKRFLLYYGMIDYICADKTIVYHRSNTLNQSISDIYPSSEWLEREVFDFFGIYYSDHPDLRRILTDYGFPSYALRKDFPVQGYFDLVYSISNKKIQFKEIEFQQSYRVFLKENPYLNEKKA